MLALWNITSGTKLNHLLAASADQRTGAGYLAAFICNYLIFGITGGLG